MANEKYGADALKNALGEGSGAPLEISNDLAETRAILVALIEEYQKGHKSRERALVITKLQEAFFWAGEGLANE